MLVELVEKVGCSSRRGGNRRVEWVVWRVIVEVLYVDLLVN